MSFPDAPSSSEPENFVRYVKRSINGEEDFHFLGFESLHRLNLTRFHVELARLKLKIKNQGHCSEPVAIMALQPSVEKSLITVGVSVAVFALFLSLVIRVSNGETLVATATYAAVMVVFVGTIIGGGRASA